MDGNARTQTNAGAWLNDVARGLSRLVNSPLVNSPLVNAPVVVSSSPTTRGPPHPASVVDQAPDRAPPAPPRDCAWGRQETRGAAGQPHAGRSRQVKHIETIKKQARTRPCRRSPPMRPTGSPTAANAASNEAPSGFHNKAFGLDGWGAIAGTLWVRISRRRCRAFGLLFLGVAAMHDEVNPIEAALEERRIGLELQRVRITRGGVREHPVLRDDGISFNLAQRDASALPAGSRES